MRRRIPIISAVLWHSRWSGGYGVTLGNMMRRVLLASLPGTAITGIKVDGVFHEFSAIEGVREDVPEIVLNLKKVRFSFHLQAQLQNHPDHYRAEGFYRR